MTQTETDLITRTIAGDSTAFEQLIFRYDKDVLSIAARFTRNAEDAKDIYQETFIRVFKGLGNFRNKSEFSTWLFRIATNVCLTHTQKKKKGEMVPLSDEEDASNTAYFAVSDSKTDAQTQGNEITRRIDTALKNLSPRQKMVFTLRHYQDYKLKDIALLMNCTEGTVKKYLFEATNKMRTYLHDLYE